MSAIQQRLTSLGIKLPDIPQVVANYVPYVISGNLVIISGQLPFAGSELKFKGRIGSDYTIEEGQEAARLCGLNILTHLKTACDGDLDRVKRCVRLGGFVNCDADFTKQPLVINGASDLMVEVLGDKGIHARAAVGVVSLPLGVAVEVEATFELEKYSPL